MRVGLNGRFLATPGGGVQRFAREVGRRLVHRATVTLHVPRGVAVPEDLEGSARVVRGILPSHGWEQLELPVRSARGDEQVLLHPANTGPAIGGCHVIVVHDLLALSHPHWFTKRYALWCRISQGRAARRAAAVLVPSAWTGREVRRLLGVPSERIHCVGAGTGPFTAPASPESVTAVRRRWDLAREYLLTTGVGDPRKNLVFLASVADRVGRRLGRPVPVAAVGGGMARVHGRRANGSPPGVVELGHVEDEDLRALYTGAAAFCFPSRAEGFGLPPLEAMACGTPAVVAPYGPAREVLGDAARIIPLDAEAWADALVPLLRDPHERSRWTERGQRVAREHTWDAVVDRVLLACRLAVED